MTASMVANRQTDAEIIYLTKGQSTQHPPFKLDEEFIKQFEGQQPNWGAVGYVTYKRTYARRVINGVFEEFWQTLQRVVEGTYQIQQTHCESLRLPWSPRKAQTSAQEMFQRFWDFKCLPPGRGLWMMGTEYVRRVGGGALNNCGYTSTEQLSTSFSSPFCFLMDMSMLGIGVGFDVKGADKVRLREPKQGDDVHVVSDDREGWVELVRRYFDAYVGDNTLPKEVDYSLVRPAGSAINGFGGTASGPEPLKELVESIKSMLDPLIGEKIGSTTIVELMNLIGRCVVAGNVRRTAELALGDASDDAYFNLKDPRELMKLLAREEELKRWVKDPDFEGLQLARVKKELEELQVQIKKVPLKHHLWASNNSIFAEVGMDYTKHAEATARNGEPGFMWLDKARRFGRLADPQDNRDMQVMGNNPCGEQSLESYELCTLVETFPANHDSYEDYQKTLKYAYLYAKTVTLVPTHDLRTNAVLLRNRRIGTSQSGIAQSMVKHGRRMHFQWSDRGYNYLRRLDGVYSRWLCVPESKKITSVKPSGTVSLLCGATPGIHFPHSEYYYRTIRFEKGSPIALALASAGYRCEDDFYTPNTTVVYFAVKEENFSRGEQDVSMWEQLEIAAQMQYYWSDNQVSVTIKFSPEEAKDIGRALELYETRLKAVSFLPHSGSGYKQAPYAAITKEEYEKYLTQLGPLDLTVMVHEVDDKFCDSSKCELLPRT